MKKITFFISVLMLSVPSVRAQNINTFAGNGSASYAGDGGQATAASLYYPIAVCADASSNLYIADCYNNVVRKINTSGVITTVAGTGAGGYNGDGVQATAASLHQPIGIWIDGSGNLIIADAYNYRVRKVNSSGIISTIAGNGVGGYSGDGSAATAAELNVPTGVTMDAAGTIYIADAYNYVVRKVNTSGVITTIAGTGISGYNGDGIQATAAELATPGELFMDGSGNLYIPDANNYRLRKVNTSGIISTIAGTGTSGFTGDGGAAISADISGISSVALDAAGDVYFTDEQNQRVRVINTSGTIFTLAGDGNTGYSGDGGPATAAELNYPHGIWVNASNKVFIADYWNNKVRTLQSPLGINEEAEVKSSIVIFPNPASNNLYIQANGIKGKVSVSLYNITGQEVMTDEVEAKDIIKLSVANISPGIYILKVTTLDGNTLVKKVEITR